MKNETGLRLTGFNEGKNVIRCNLNDLPILPGSSGRSRVQDVSITPLTFIKDIIA
jgi:hypothetical protein